MNAALLRLPGIDALDLDAYCGRIGYRGARTPTLATLRELQWRHVTTIPFENLTSLAGEAVLLEPAALQSKMVYGRRGGYCYEQNVLFAAVLQRLGFQVTGLAARVVWSAPDAAIRARTHMLLRLELPEGSHIADVGFGSASLPAPLRLLTEAAQPTPIEPFRLVRHIEGYQLELQLPDGWKPVYTFDLQPQQFVDYQMANWFVSTWPASRFVQELMVARPAGTRRHTLLDVELGSRPLAGDPQRRRLSSVAELRHALAEQFDIDVPASAGMQAALERIVARHR
ncbi:MAG: arylamine N-acetyltransferase [Gammaproteobacteria bacterium]|nr:arylamine N-acetyltransferase [Gammaproteobacteria bacterium]